MCFTVVSAPNLQYPTHVSNYDEGLETVLKTMELHHNFRFILTLHCAGFAKPDSQIFHLALDQLDNGRIKRQDVLHVGDTPEIDYIGAVNAGWNANLVHQDAKKLTEHYQYVEPEPVFQILSDFQSYICMYKK